VTEPVRLFEVPPVSKLTDRQARALEFITGAGWAGLTSDELGQAIHSWQGRHGLDEQCLYCGTAGAELGRVLRREGLARQSRRSAGGESFLAWVTEDTPQREPVERDDQDIPF
jgi:hypothetical protein